MEHLAPNGPVYQAGTLSGNPLAMVAGLTQLRELEQNNGFRHLDQLGERFETGLSQILSDKGIPHRLNRVGSMFCLYFLDEDIINVDTVTKQDFDIFKKLFWSCLKEGIYLAPSPYETGFLSMAHTNDDIDETLDVIGQTIACLLYTSPSPRDQRGSRMPSSA